MKDGETHLRSSRTIRSFPIPTGKWSDTWSGKKRTREEAFPSKGKSNKIKGSLMCHQCQRNDKSGVVHCSLCKSKRFCYECIERWYPGKSREEFEDACPFCRGNCNCKAWLREFFVTK